MMISASWVVEFKLGELKLFYFLKLSLFFCLLKKYKRHPSHRSNSVLLLAGGQGGLAHREFGSSFKPITTRGQIMPNALLLAYPDLKT